MKPVPQPLDKAIDSYLGWATVHAFKEGSGTPRTYRIKLGMYAREFGPTTPVLRLSGQDWYSTCETLWSQKSPETYNSGRRAALSFLTYCRESEPPLSTAQPPKLWKPRKVPTDRSRALPETTVASFMDLERYPLREVALWSLLYDSSERLSAVLSLDVEALDLDLCVATVRIKGGDSRYIAWTPATSGLLRTLLGGREKGPVFLGTVQPWNWRERPASDRGPGGLYRLTAHRARCVFKELTGTARPHRLRHSRLTHLGGAHGTNSAMLKAISGHTSDRMVAHYSRPGPEQIAAFMAQVAQLMQQ